MEPLAFIFWLREVGVFIKNVDITSGEIITNLNEELFAKNKTSSSDTVSHAVGSVAATKPQKKQASSSLTKYTSVFPETVGESVNDLDRIVSAFTFVFLYFLVYKHDLINLRQNFWTNYIYCS